jgi:hypothetical protein
MLKHFDKMQTPEFKSNLVADARGSSRSLHTLLAGFIALAACTGNVRAGSVSVPNGSFESPETSYADPGMDAWQKASEPAWYMGGGGFPWDQLVGQFLNTTNGSPTHIDNMEGRQGAFLFAQPDVAIFQDYNSISGTNAIPTHEFNARFEVGNAYALKVGLIGGGGGMSNGVPLQISLYYRDAGSNRVTVAATTITNSAEQFPNNTHFVDFQTRTPFVRTGDAWAGQNIGIELASTVGFDLHGGYWDLDNVRLETVPAPVLTAWGVTNGQFRFTLESEPGRWEILACANITLPSSNWTSLETITNLTGSVLFTDTNTAAGSRFYQARQAP